MRNASWYVAGALAIGAFALFRQRNTARRRCQASYSEAGVPFQQSRRAAAEYCGTYPAGTLFHGQA